MRFNIYDGKKFETVVTVRLDEPNDDGSVDLVVVDEDGDSYEPILTFRADGKVIVADCVETHGFKTDSDGHVIVEESLQ